MSKSKTVGNKNLNIKIFREKTKEEIEQEKKRLWIDINEILIPKWLTDSEVYYTLDEKKAECWRELLKFLFKAKAINIGAIKDLIEIHRGHE